MPLVGWLSVALRPQKPKVYWGREPRTATSTSTQLLSSLMPLAPLATEITSTAPDPDQTSTLRHRTNTHSLELSREGNDDVPITPVVTKVITKQE